MKTAAWIGTAGLSALAVCAAWAGDWEAFEAETKSLGSPKRVMIASVGKGEPFLDSLASAHESKFRGRGYGEPAVQRTAGYSIVWPEFKNIDDVREWLKDGHKVRSQSGSAGKVGGVAALAAMASSAIKSDCKLDAVLAVEAREVGGGKKKLMGALGKKMGMAEKASPTAAYETRLTLLTEKGEVVWSEVERVDKEALEKQAEAREDQQMDMMRAKTEEATKDLQAKTAGQRASAADSAMAEQFAKMTPEQRAMAEQAMANSQAAQAQMPPQSGMMKGIMKMTRAADKRDIGGPENWGPLAAEAAWQKLESRFPKID